MEQDCLVIDNGSGTMKVGFSGEDHPRAVFPTAVELPSKSQKGKTPWFKLEKNGRKNSVSSETSDRTIPNFSAYPANGGSEGNRTSKFQENQYHPIERGYICDWDAMEKIWDHAITKELQVDSESVPILMTDCLPNINEHREKMAQIVLEKYSSPGFYVASKPVLSMFASGRTRGVVVESGAGVTSVVPIFEGFALSHSTKRVDFAGDDLTALLAKKLNSKKNIFSNEIVQRIKEQICCVEPSEPPTNREKSNHTIAYELPDGKVIEIENETATSIPEALFDKTNSFGGLSSLLHESISMCEDSLAPDLYGSIVLAGGTSTFPGFSSRIESEISKLCTSAYKIEVVPDSQRKYAAWIGGSMFASLETFPQMVVTKKEWDEVGPNILAKCFT